jgi:prepilin-type N-terminal cleavage/methylation domain-containing protein
MSFKNKIPYVKQKGFTLVELVVVVGIFTLIMSVALWNQRSLNNNILISNLGYEIALAVRETQAYGIGVRARTGASTAQDFRGGFGMFVDLSSPQQIIVFNDLDNDQVYDAPTEIFATYQFRNQNGNRITALCAEQNANQPCGIGGPTSYQQLTILFKRPNPEALFSAVGTKGNGGSTGVKSGPAYIVINTPTQNNCRAIIIDSTGQIRVESATSETRACVNY